ncbi:hypothetical protein D3C72_1261120 [compost metagenome]
MACLDPGKVDAPLAHDVHDHLAPDQIVGVQRQPSLDGEFPAFDGRVVLVEHLRVLAVGIADASDGGHAERDQVAVRLRAVALEIAVQFAALFGNGERVAIQREVVHADVGIALLQEAIDGGAEQADTRGAVGQIRFVDAPLRLESFGQVGVRIERDAVGPQCDDLRDGAGK